MEAWRQEECDDGWEKAILWVSENVGAWECLIGFKAIYIYTLQWEESRELGHNKLPAQGLYTEHGMFYGPLQSKIV